MENNQNLRTHIRHQLLSLNEFQRFSKKSQLKRVKRRSSSIQQRVRKTGVDRVCPTCSKNMVYKTIHAPSCEHIRPLRHGGTNSSEGRYPNVIPMCGMCNDARNQVVLEFGMNRRVLQFLIEDVYLDSGSNDRELSKFFKQAWAKSIAQRMTKGRGKGGASKRRKTAQMNEKTHSKSQTLIIPGPSPSKIEVPRSLYGAIEKCSSRPYISPDTLRSDLIKFSGIQREIDAESMQNLTIWKQKKAYVDSLVKSVWNTIHGNMKVIQIGQIEAIIQRTKIIHYKRFNSPRKADAIMAA